MLKVTDAIHELMGEGGPTSSTSEVVRGHVDKVFETMDTNSDGQITIEEFVNYCNTHTEVRESMSVLP